MAKNKNDLFALINTNLPDNTSKSITPAAVREVETQNADSALNVLESTAQTVVGPVNFTNSLSKSGKAVLVGGAVAEVLRSSNPLPQSPSGLGNPLQVIFGAASGTPSDPVQIAATGAITFNQAGKYAVRAKFAVGRTAAAGTSIVLTRMLRNGVQVGSIDASMIETANQIYSKESRVAIDVLAGDVVTFQVARDPSGSNFGGLVTFAATGALSAWGTAPSALVVVERFTGVTS